MHAHIYPAICAGSSVRTARAKTHETSANSCSPSSHVLAKLKGTSRNRIESTATLNSHHYFCVECTSDYLI